jgi:hypothetical protein
MTAWSINLLPYTIRWLAHFSDSSTMTLAFRMALPVEINVSHDLVPLARGKLKVLTGHGPSFMVEIAEDDSSSLMLLAEQVLDGDFDVVERDVGCASRWRVRRLYGFGLDTLASFDKEHTQAFASLNTGDEVV